MSLGLPGPLRLSPISSTKLLQGYAFLSMGRVPDRMSHIYALSSAKQVLAAVVKKHRQH